MFAGGHQFVTNLDGVDIHFIHVRSKHPKSWPLIITQAAGLDHGRAEGHRSDHEPDGPWRKCIRRIRRRDSVAPRLWILGEAY
jgi:Epoxide hydrolase N terminus